MLEISSVGVLTAFLAGAISFLSPCVLPLVPAYVSYIAGSADRVLDPTEARAWRRSTIGLSALFVLGFSTVFIALGASAPALCSVATHESSVVNCVIVPSMIE